jgi:hypothetical protein
VVIWQEPSFFTTKRINAMRGVTEEECGIEPKGERRRYAMVLFYYSFGA